MNRRVDDNDDDLERQDDELVDDGDDFEDEETERTVVMSDDSFSDPDISMEVNVEKLVAEFEKADDSDDKKRKAEIRRRLEELADSRNLDDTFAIDFDDD